MAEYIIKITLETDALIGSGESFGALIDTDVVYDECGIPFIPAKRIKGLLKFSMEFLFEIFTASGINYLTQEDIDRIFGSKGSEKASDILFSNLYIEDYNKNKKAIINLSRKYPDFLSKENVINHFTSIRHQIEINGNGTTKDKSLRTIRTLNKETKFVGGIKADEKAADMLSLACQNLRYFGTKRNKGLGSVKCELCYEDNENKTVQDKVLMELEALCKN